MIAAISKPFRATFFQRLQRVAAKLELPSRIFPQQRRRAKVGFVSLVGAGPGSADLITLRGLKRLQAADVIYYDRLADPALLQQARSDAVCVYVGKAPGRHSMTQAQINGLLVQAALAGQEVVRLKCGDPGIFARGAEEADALTAAGVGWEIVPGVTSACAAAASAGSFLTERGKTARLVLATGHLRPDGEQDWADTARPGTTLACYMGVAQAEGITRGLLLAGWPSFASVQVVSKAQTQDEQVHSCTLTDLPALCRRHCDLSPAIILVRWSSEVPALDGAMRKSTQEAPVPVDCSIRGAAPVRRGLNRPQPTSLV